MFKRRPSQKFAHLDAITDDEFSSIKDHFLDMHLWDVSLCPSDDSITRPTVPSARKSPPWCRQRRQYEDKSHSEAQGFHSSPYMQKQYPSISKHYPGTWSVVSPEKLRNIVQRVSKSTATSMEREKSGRKLFRDDGRYSLVNQGTQCNIFMYDEMTPRDSGIGHDLTRDKDYGCKVDFDMSSSILRPISDYFATKDTPLSNRWRPGTGRSISSFGSHKIDSSGAYVVSPPVGPMVFWYPDVEFRSRKKTTQSSLKKFTHTISV